MQRRQRPPTGRQGQELGPARTPHPLRPKSMPPDDIGDDSPAQETVSHARRVWAATCRWWRSKRTASSRLHKMRIVPSALWTRPIGVGAPCLIGRATSTDPTDQFLALVVHLAAQTQDAIDALTASSPTFANASPSQSRRRSGGCRHADRQSRRGNARPRGKPRSMNTRDPAWERCGPRRNASALSRSPTDSALASSHDQPLPRRSLPRGCASTDGFIITPKQELFLCRPTGGKEGRGDAIAMVMHAQGCAKRRSPSSPASHYRKAKRQHHHHRITIAAARRRPAKERRKAATTAQAMALWNSGRDPRGTPGQTYLNRDRKLDLDPDCAARSCAGIPASTRCSHCFAASKPASRKQSPASCSTATRIRPRACSPARSAARQSCSMRSRTCLRASTSARASRPA